jgi:hypothetical protein
MPLKIRYLPEASIEARQAFQESRKVLQLMDPAVPVSGRPMENPQRSERVSECLSDAALF